LTAKYILNVKFKFSSIPTEKGFYSLQVLWSLGFFVSEIRELSTYLFQANTGEVKGVHSLYTSEKIPVE